MNLFFWRNAVSFLLPRIQSLASMSSAITQRKKSTDDEEDEAAMRKKITGKKDEVAELVKFVKQACAEATQSEEEVAQTIGIITQIEE